MLVVYANGKRRTKITLKNQESVEFDKEGDNKRSLKIKNV